MLFSQRDPKSWCATLITNNLIFHYVLFIDAQNFGIRSINESGKSESGCKSAPVLFSSRSTQFSSPHKGPQSGKRVFRFRDLKGKDLEISVDGCAWQPGSSNNSILGCISSTSCSFSTSDSVTSVPAIEVASAVLFVSSGFNVVFSFFFFLPFLLFCLFSFTLLLELPTAKGKRPCPSTPAAFTSTWNQEKSKWKLKLQPPLREAKVRKARQLL